MFEKCDIWIFLTTILSFCLSLSLSRLRVLWPAGHGGRYNLQPADNSLLHPPRSVWPAEMVPLLCAAQQEGSGQRLDCRWKRQMAVDPGNSPTELRKDGIPHWDWQSFDSFSKTGDFSERNDFTTFLILFMNHGSIQSFASEATYNYYKPKRIMSLEKSLLHYGFANVHHPAVLLLPANC